MEGLIMIVTFALLIGMIASPVVILVALNKLKARYKFATFIGVGVITTAIIAVIFGWWSDASKEILLLHYGYDFEAMNETERFAKVSEDNMERVKTLEMSAMGVGWPVRALISYLVYSPYLLTLYLAVYFVNVLIRRRGHRLVERS